MNWNYLFALILVLLAMPGCSSIRPVSITSLPTDSAPAPSPTPESPSAIPPSERVPRITIEELLRKIQSNADIVIVDTRVDVEEQFPLGHIKGAISAPLSEITSGRWLPPAGKEIIFYRT
jgi:hypothetical protein